MLQRIWNKCPGEEFDNPGGDIKVDDIKTGIRVIIFGGLILLILIYILGPRWDAGGAALWVAKEDGRPLIMAHGGGKELYPENTLLAFDAAAEFGVDALEMDVNLTADDVLVTIHGPGLEETTNGTGPVRQVTFVKLQKLDAGYRFTDDAGRKSWEGKGIRHPSLRQVLERYRSTPLKFVIELKNRGEDGVLSGKLLAQLLQDLDLEDRVMVASFSTRTLQAFRRASRGQVPTSGSEAELRRQVLPMIFGLDKWWLVPGPVAALQMPLQGAGFDLSRRKVIRRAHQHNQAVHYWTIDDPEVMRQLARRGADGIITDRPDVARDTFREMGYTLPERIEMPEINYGD